MQIGFFKIMSIDFSLLGFQLLIELLQQQLFVFLVLDDLLLLTTSLYHLMNLVSQIGEAFIYTCKLLLLVFT